MLLFYQISNVDLETLFRVHRKTLFVKIRFRSQDGQGKGHVDYLGRLETIRKDTDLAKF